MVDRVSWSIWEEEYKRGVKREYRKWGFTTVKGFLLHFNRFRRMPFFGFNPRGVNDVDEFVNKLEADGYVQFLDWDKPFDEHYVLFLKLIAVVEPTIEGSFLDYDDLIFRVIRALRKRRPVRRIPFHVSDIPCLIDQDTCYWIYHFRLKPVEEYFEFSARKKIILKTEKATYEVKLLKGVDVVINYGKVLFLNVIKLY